MIDATLLRYALVGVANTGVGFGFILILQQVAGWAPTMANAAGYVLGIVMSYVLNRRFAFRSRRAHRRAVPEFLVAAALSYLLNVLVLRMALGVFGLNAVLAQAVAVLSYTLSFYLISRHVIFARLNP